MLLLKLTLVPIIILLVSLASRYWGAFIGGLLAGLPLVAAPITLLLAIEFGQEFAIESAGSTLLGVIALSCFCFVYAWSATQFNWMFSLIISLIVYFFTALAVSEVTLNAILACGIVLLVVFLLRSNLPKFDIDRSDIFISNYEIIVRMLASAILVLLVTSLANILGARLSGVLAVFPVAATVLAVFTHKYCGENQVALLLKGLMLGTFSLVLFYFSLILLSQELSFYFSFVVSLVIVIIFQAIKILLAKWIKN